jgi:nucleoside-diphosphate-sugar epimerase
MSLNKISKALLKPDDRILITGASGFIGVHVVKNLLERGYRNLCCFLRPSSNLSKLNAVINSVLDAKVDFVIGNLSSANDCTRAAKGAKVVFHLAAGRGKSYADTYLNSVVTTKNILESIESKEFLRFVNISSFAVYSNEKMKRGSLINEETAIDTKPLNRFDPYAYAKIEQERILKKLCAQRSLPYVNIRPGAVFGPGKPRITGRIGTDTFGVFFLINGRNQIPFTYVTNCADAIVLAGLTPGIDGEVFNIVDDNLPRGGDFLKMYKQNVKVFSSIYIPYWIFYCFSAIWEWYSKWSMGQLPAVFNRSDCSSMWKGNTYSNFKLKQLLNWNPLIPFDEASKIYFDSISEGDLT